MLCGFLCGGGADPIDRWLDQLVPAVESEDASRQEAREALRELAAPIENAVRGPDLALDIPLPEESAALLERATAVYDWVRGYLYAMGVLGISERDLSEEGREVFRDFADLTRMDLDALDESEENEEALMEVTEFVRVAAMVIHDERSAPKEATKKP